MAEKSMLERREYIDSVVNRIAERAEKVKAEAPEGKDPTKELAGNPVSTGPRIKPPEEIAKKQVDRAKAAADEWIKNVVRPKRNPVEAAVAAKEKRANAVRESLAEDRWGNAMGKVDIDTMYKIIEDVGAAGFRAGVEKKAGKVGNFWKEWHPMMTAHVEELDRMPVDTLEDRIAKSEANIRGLNELGKARKGVS